MSLEVEGKNESVVHLSSSFLAGGGISIKMLHDHLTLFSPLVFFSPSANYIDFLYLTMKFMYGTSLVVQWLRCHIFNAGEQGLIPGWGIKVPHAMQPKKKIKNNV